MQQQQPKSPFVGLEKVKNPLGLSGWILDHFSYDIKHGGDCRKNLTKCLLEIKEEGRFRGVCEDVSIVFSYFYMKLGFGDPIFLNVLVQTGNHTEEHAEVAFYWKDEECSGAFFVFYGIYPVKKIVRIFYADDYFGANGLGRYLNFTVRKTKSDEFAYRVIRKTGVVPYNGEDLYEYAKRINKPLFARYHAHIEPLVLKVGTNTVHVLGINNPPQGEGCQVIVPDAEKWCPMIPHDITVITSEPGICRLSNYYLVISP